MMKPFNALPLLVLGVYIYSASHAYALEATENHAPKLKLDIGMGYEHRHSQKALAGQEAFLSAKSLAVSHSDWIPTLGLSYSARQQTELYGKAKGLFSRAYQADTHGGFTAHSTDKALNKLALGVKHQFMRASRDNEQNIGLMGFVEVLPFDRKNAIERYKAWEFGTVMLKTMNPVTLSLLTKYQHSFTQPSTVQPMVLKHSFSFAPQASFAVHRDVTFLGGITWKQDYKKTAHQYSAPYLAKTASTLLDAGVSYQWSKNHNILLMASFPMSGQDAGAELYVGMQTRF